MDKVTKSPNILILRGIKTIDFLQPRRVAQPAVTPEHQYTIIPTVFTGVATWPTKSNLQCWECGLIPDSYPKFVPLYPRIVDGTDHCDVHGHFDEWNCAVRYATKEFPKNCWDVLMAIAIFEAKFSGRLKQKIPVCPPRTLMKSYCGNAGITEHEYKQMIAELNTEFGT